MKKYYSGKSFESGINQFTLLDSPQNTRGVFAPGISDKKTTERIDIVISGKNAFEVFVEKKLLFIKFEQTSFCQFRRALTLATTFYKYLEFGSSLQPDVIHQVIQVVDGL